MLATHLRQEAPCAQRRLGRRMQFGTLAAFAVVLMVSQSRAQSGSTLGGWEGPIDWSAQIFAAGPPPCSVEFSHAVLLPTGNYRGKVMLWRFEVNATCTTGSNTTETWIMDPAFQGPSPLLIRVPQDLHTNIFCSGASADINGEIVVAGGTQYLPPPAMPPNNFTIPDDTLRFRPQNLGGLIWDITTGYPSVGTDPSALPWIELGPQGEMNISRFYPTLMPLRKGAIQPGVSADAGCSFPGSSHLALGGTPFGTNVVDGNEAWEVLGPGATSWSCGIVPRTGTIHSFARPLDRFDVIPFGGFAPEVLFDSYPRAKQLSDGNIFVAFDVNTAETCTSGNPPVTVPCAVVNKPGQSWIIKPRYVAGSQQRWELWNGPWATPGFNPLVPTDPSGDRFYAPLVMMHRTTANGGPNRILAFGGSYDSNYYTASSPGANPTWLVTNIVQEYRASVNDWIPKRPMAYARVLHNAVVLPTGSVLLVGGTNVDTYHAPSTPIAPLFEPEIYDPSPFPTSPGSTTLMNRSNTSSTVTPPARTPRLYHSVALLQPDGRVFVAGGERPPPSYPNSEYSGEFFSPPYLFQSFRPIINRAPSQAQIPASLGTITFDLTSTVKIGHVIDSVVLIRPGAVTHFIDMDQVYIEMEFSSLELLSNPTLGTTRFKLTVSSPDETLCPPGWYMLFVVEKDPPSGVRVPSVASWIEMI